MIDPNNNGTTYQYNVRGLLDKVIDATNKTTTFVYDLERRQTEVQDANGNVTTFVYDAIGQVTNRKDPLGTVTYTYDKASNLTSITDRRGCRRDFLYDAADRLTTETWVACTASPARTITYTYDNADRLTGATDPSSKHALNYTPSGLLKSVNNTGTPNVPSVTVTYTYDAASRRTRVDDSQGGVTTSTYDNADRLTTITQGTGAAAKRVDFQYNKRDQITTMTRYQGPLNTLVTQAALLYRDDGRLSELTHTGLGGLLRDKFQLGYDAGGRITSVATTSSVPGVDHSTTYSYDAVNQLTGVTSTLQNEAYGYANSMGNRTSSASGTDSRTYTYDPAPNGNKVKSDGKFNYSYDAEGNLLSKTEIATTQTTFYSWDHRNRLTRVELRANTSPTSTLLRSVIFTYDVFDRRIGKEVDVDGAGPVTPNRETYVYDGPHVILEFFDTNLADATPGSLVRRNLYGLAVDMILATEHLPGNTVYWHLTDWLGSVRDLVDSSGNIVKHVDYDSFGNIIRVTDGSGAIQTPGPTTPLGPGANSRFLYTSREFDAETKLQYNRARYYDAAIGRFISQDPIGFHGGDVNLYRYVGNNSGSSTDPTGHDEVAMTQRETEMRRKQREEDRRRRAEEEGSITNPRKGPDVGPDGGFFSMDTVWWFGGWRKERRSDDTYYWYRYRNPAKEWKEDAEKIPFNPVPTSVISKIYDGEFVAALEEAAIDFTVGKVFKWGGHLWEKLPNGTFRYLGVAAGAKSNIAEELTEDAAIVARKKASKIEKDIIIDSKKYKETADHIKDAQKAGHPAELTIDRKGKPTRRKEAMEGTSPVPCKDRDEYPPAVFKEGGKGASVRPIDPSDNRGAGAVIGNEIRDLPDGAKVRIRVDEE